MSPSIEMRDCRECAREFKFLVLPAVAKQVRDWGRAHLEPDPNGSGQSLDTYDVTSLYFDTVGFDVFHQRGSYGRGKYRIRHYAASPMAFLERKLRTKALLVKRRAAVPLQELHRLAAGQPDRDWAGCWFHSRLLKRRLQPVCQVSYRRTARVAMTANGPIRLTVDADLRAQCAEGYNFRPGRGVPILPHSQVVELKFRRTLPVLFKNLVEEFALNLQPFSKYRQAAAALEIVFDHRAAYQPLPMLPAYA